MYIEEACADKDCGNDSSKIIVQIRYIFHFVMCYINYAFHFNGSA